MKLKWIALLALTLISHTGMADQLSVFKIYTEFVRQASVIDGHLRDHLGFPEFLPPEKIQTDRANKYIIVRGLKGLYIIDIAAAHGQKDVPYFLVSLRTLSGMAKSLTKGKFGSVDVSVSETGSLTFATSTGGGLFGMGSRSGPSSEMTFERVLEKAKSTSTYSEMKAYAAKKGESLTALFEKAYSFDPVQVVTTKHKRVAEYFLAHAQPEQIQEFKTDQVLIFNALEKIKFGIENQARPELKAKLATKKSMGTCERLLVN